MQLYQNNPENTHPKRKKSRIFFLYCRRYRLANQPEKEQKMHVRFFYRKITLYARVTVDGVRCRNDFSFRVNIKPPSKKGHPQDGEWSTAEQRVLGDSEKAQRANAKVEYVRNVLFDFAEQMASKNVRFSADDVKKLFQGQSVRLKDEWGRQRKIDA